jgi:hypothetical protein
MPKSYLDAGIATSALKMEIIVSPKRWHLPTRLHGAKTQKNTIIVIILTAVKT